ncbi:unnamed protein product [Acanthoscelides obtectus]|uniref:Uncharacterized protein n=1 Tax=Acanthoscelides obtectus TaxID=200917 RepID=A0A9P0PTU3_ACAOB|nr:unnamed protein product [Acanthoscelides obtectus]CAK1670072.1 hypothetical protein AOBTE_LOCUS27374 [Acanthoscelides obtectus]
MKIGVFTALKFQVRVTVHFPQIIINNTLANTKYVAKVDNGMVTGEKIEQNKLEFSKQ